MINLKELVDNIQNLLSTNNICPCVDENNNIQFILGAREIWEFETAEKICIYKTNQKYPSDIKIGYKNLEDSVEKILKCVYDALKDFGTKTENYFDIVKNEKLDNILKYIKDHSCSASKIRTIIKLANIVYNEKNSKQQNKKD